MLSRSARQRRKTTYIFVVPVMTGPRPKVRQRTTLMRDEDVKLIPVDHAVLVVVDQAQNLVDNFLLARFGYVLVRLIHEAICAENFAALPLAIAVVIVEREEGGGVEVGRVVLLYGLGASVGLD